MKRGLYLFTLIVLLAINSNAQVSDVLSSIDVSTAVENQPVQITGELLNPSQITAAVLNYRPFGEGEYIRREMEIIGGTISIQIPAQDVMLPSIEYYILFTTVDGNVVSYPLGSPEETQPERIQVTEAAREDDEVIFLSPPQGATVAIEDLFVSISLLRLPDSIKAENAKLTLNGRDVTDKVLTADDLILFYPENFPGTVTPGIQFLKVDFYKPDGSLYKSVGRSFNAQPGKMIAAYGDQFRYNLELEGETRNEQYGGGETWYNNLDTRFDGSYSDWDVDARLYLTSEEKNYLQPQNRYSATIRSDWLKLTGGDSYPQYPELIMNGKRVRGISGELDLGFFNLQASYGQVSRGLEGAVIETIPRDSVVFGSDIIEVDSLRYGQPFARASLGTFERDLLAVRPSFKAGETFELGFSFLHSKDDVNSIEFGSKPQENLVFGTDIGFAFDNRRIQLNGEAAVSLNNSDISTGTLSDAAIDTVFGDDGIIDVEPETVKDFKNILGNLMTVNQYLGPWNPEELASFAGEASLMLRYFNNNIRAKYIYRGNEFQSFGQSFIKTDVKGFNVVDRISMIGNKLFLSLGYERLEDNLQETKPATTTFQTLNTSVSIYPGNELPNITLGYTRFKNENDLATGDSTFISSAVDEGTNKFYAQLYYNFDYLVRHRSSFNFSSSTRDDNTLRENDASSTSISANISSEWDNTFKSHFGIVYYTSEVQLTPYDYSSFKLGGTFYLMDNLLELRATLSPSFGDFERQALDLVGNYRVLQNLNLMLQVRVYRVPGQSTNSIIGLTTRYVL